MRRHYFSKRPLVIALLGVLSTLSTRAGQVSASPAHHQTTPMHQAGGFGDLSSLAPAPQPVPLKVAPANDFGFLSPKTVSPAPANPAKSVSDAAAPAPRPAGAAVPAAATVQPANPAVNLTLDGTLVAAQPVPYDSETSTFTLTPNLGRQAGGNLFYSFSAFSLSTGQTASFTGTPASPVQNVLVRVTGVQTSTIDGTLACTYPNANFFFMNPAGITFTSNASLNLQGGLALTTGDYIGFADNTRFTAVNGVSGTMLSAAAPSSFGFASSNAPAGITIDGATLQLPAAKPLLVVAGSLTMNGGMLSAPGGPIDLATVGPGAQASFDPTTFSLAAIAVPAGAVTMTNAATIATDGPAAGAFSLQCGSLSMTGGSQITASSTGAGNGGGVMVSVTGDAALSGSDAAGDDSGIYSRSEATATGNAGSVSFSSATLELTDGARINSSTYGAGRGGALTVNVSGEAVLSGADANAAQDSGLFDSSDPPGAGGAAGSITLTADSLQLLGGGTVSFSTFGLGKGGDVTVDVTGPAMLSGADANAAHDSGIYADSVSFSAGGAAGSVTLTANSLQILGGAEIASNTFGAGKGGDIVVNVSGQAVLSGAEPGAAHDSGVFADTQSAVPAGSAGSITLTAGSLQLLGGAAINSSTYGAGKGGDVGVNVSGQILLSGADAKDTNSGIYVDSVSAGAGGDAGNIALTAGSLQVVGGAEIASSTFGAGNGGSVTVNVSGQALLSGADANAAHDSGIYANSDSASAGGDAGDVTLIAESLQVLRGAAINSSTLGAGEGGNVTVDVSGEVMVSGADASNSDSGVFAQSVSSGSAGAAGNIKVSAASLQVLGGAAINSTTYGSGRGGEVTVNVSGPAMLAGADANAAHDSGIFANSESSLIGGDAGSVTFTAANLRVLGGAEIASGTFGAGEGGSVTVKVSGATILSGADTGASHDSGIFAASNSSGTGGTAGSIALDAGSLRVRGGAAISSSTLAQRGNAGSVSVTVRGRAMISGMDASDSPSGLLTESYPGSTGNAGSIALAAGSLSVSNGAEVTSSAPLSQAGDLVLSSRSELLLSSATVTVSSGGDGGNVSLVGGRRLFVQRSLVTGQAGANGGHITLSAPLVAIGESIINGLSKKRPVQVSITGKQVLISDSEILTDHPQFFPEIDVSAALVPLQTPLGSLSLLPGSCIVSGDADSSSFVVPGRGGAPAEPGGWLPEMQLDLEPREGHSLKAK
jgi:filamentous hemagglutinin family protein